MKVCEFCREPFDPGSGRGAHRRISCQACLEHPDHKKQVDKNKNLQRVYGITLFQYREMVKSQNNSCLICGLNFRELNYRPTKGGTRAPNEAVVDHCHSTGKVRGILCHNCNIAAGHLQDSPERARAMAEYLEKHEVSRGRALSDE